MAQIRRVWILILPLALWSCQTNGLPEEMPPDFKFEYEMREMKSPEEPAPAPEAPEAPPAEGGESPAVRPSCGESWRERWIWNGLPGKRAIHLNQVYAFRALQGGSGRAGPRWQAGRAPVRMQAYRGVH